MEAITQEVSAGRWLSALILALLVACAALAGAVAWLYRQLHSARVPGAGDPAAMKAPSTTDKLRAVLQEHRNLEGRLAALSEGLLSVHQSLTDQLAAHAAQLVALREVVEALSRASEASREHLSRKLSELRREVLSKTEEDDRAPLAAAPKREVAKGR
jgi:hypothetical protein